MRVRFPPLPPSSPGRPLRSRRRSEKPDKHVRLVPLAPSVTVAEWLRRQTVDLSTRVQFPPVTPAMRASFNGENTSVLTKKCRFDSSRSLQIFDTRGLGKRINPLGLGPRESRFKSEVPDQVLWGSQVVRRLAVNQFMRRFESCPHSQYAGVAFWLRAPLLQRGAVEFDPLPRYQHFEVTARLWPRGFRHRSSFLTAHNGNVHPVRPSDTRLVRSTLTQISQALHAEVVQWQDEGL